MNIDAIKCDVCGKITEESNAISYEPKTDRFIIYRRSAYNYVGSTEKDACSITCANSALNDWYATKHQEEPESDEVIS